ncbi:hypothetical protein MVEG_10445 [Podila verticillata NRRL 6337]|nr:hypothetical protein MVEG_10445 [Podila verticillata NRRL 6337]
MTCFGRHRQHQRDDPPFAPSVPSLDGSNQRPHPQVGLVWRRITSTLILPGSGNIMSDEAYTVKLCKADTLSTSDMLAEAGIEDKWRHMKTCGENPKLVYGQYFHTMPSTCLGEGWLLRDQFAKALKLKDAQNDWCQAVENLPKYGHCHLNTPFPKNLQYESLVAVLRDDVKLKFHCYETHDLETMVRHSNEYKFKISAFHHSLDAYHVPEIMKRAYKVVPTVANFAGKFGYKKEAFQSSVNAPKILVDASIVMAMKSDHPVLNSQHLVYEAAMARHYGLSEKLAPASITTVPAKALGLDYRIGKITVGMDIDVIIWERHLLALGSHPLQVYIDGIAQIEDVDESKWSEQGKPQESEEYPELVAPKVKAACTSDAKTGVFSGIRKILLKDSEEFSAKGDLTVVIDHGEVVCAGHCAHEAAAFKDAPVYDLGGEGVVVPSLLSVGAPGLGLVEISAEDSTGDGHHNLQPDIAYAIDGLKFGGLHMDEAYKACVQIAVTAPHSEHVIQGVSVTFLTGAQTLVTKGAIIKKKLALHVHIGQDSKSTLFPTVSSQIGFLCTALEKSLADLFSPNDKFTLVARGKIPLVIEVNNRDEIICIIQLKKELEHKGANIKFALLGAIEAWTVAEYLVEAEIGVILKPYLCTPVQCTAQKCLLGTPLNNETGLSHLRKAGIKVGLVVLEGEDVWVCVRT